MAGKSRELTGKRTGIRSTTMKDKYGNILTQRDEVIRRERKENVKNCMEIPEARNQTLAMSYLVLLF